MKSLKLNWLLLLAYLLVVTAMALSDADPFRPIWWIALMLFGFILCVIVDKVWS